jgi:ComF family protein
MMHWPGRNWLIETLDAFWPAMLDADEAAVARRAWAADAADAYCPRCGASAGPGSVLPHGCAHCREQRLPWHRLTRLGAYETPLADWIKALKFAGHWPWAPWLGQNLADRVAPPPGRVAVCPVPMHWLRRCQRGYNQAQLIAQALAQARQWPIAPLLKRARHTTPQTAMAPSQRAANVRGSFTIDRLDLSGWHIILVDDIKTTGATLSQCARLLSKQGARTVEVAVAAVADPKGQGFQSI